MSDAGSSEERLLERARAGDGDAFAELTTRHEPVVRGLLHRTLGARADVDDLLQETRLRALRALGGFRGGATFRTWISRIALNLAISEIRRRRVRETQPLDPDLTGAGEEPWLQAGRIELRERLGAAVDRLPPALRQAFHMRYTEGFDATDIAARLRTPAATIRTRLFHARRRLRETLDDLVSE